MCVCVFIHVSNMYINLANHSSWLGDKRKTNGHKQKTAPQTRVKRHNEGQRSERVQAALTGAC